MVSIQTPKEFYDFLARREYGIFKSGPNSHLQAIIDGMEAEFRQFLPAADSRASSEPLPLTIKANLESFVGFLYENGFNLSTKN